MNDDDVVLLGFVIFVSLLLFCEFENDSRFFLEWCYCVLSYRLFVASFLILFLVMDFLNVGIEMVYQFWTC